MAFTIANAGLGNLALYPRQLTPMYVPLVVVVIVAADALLSNRHRVPRAVSRAPQVLIAALVICAGYAAYVSARDTHTALLNPEYGLNAYVYNAEHIDIETASVKDYLDGLVGDSGPVVRAHFDLYFDDGSLIYFKEECSREDFEHRGVPLDFSCHQSFSPRHPQECRCGTPQLLSREAGREDERRVPCHSSSARGMTSRSSPPASAGTIPSSGKWTSPRRST